MPENDTPISIHWFRRDLRLDDNAGFYRALRGDHPVLPLFIFDKNILDKLPTRDARVEFLQRTVEDLQRDLRGQRGDLIVRYGTPEQVWRDLLEEYPIGTVYTNHDYETYAKERDGRIEDLLAERDIPFRTYKDHVIFEKSEVVKNDGNPYVVFTPYKNKWLEKLTSRAPVGSKTSEETDTFYLQPYPNRAYFGNLFPTSEPLPMPSLADMGFEPTNTHIPPVRVADELIRHYDETRNFPAIEGTSRLGIHLRHGTVSIRAKARRARALNDTFLVELVWRDFYAQILHHFPHVETAPFRAKYEAIPWRDDEDDFQRWCDGTTGYPIVDAGMRELNETGYMHNRVRMIVASFLTKHLLLSWQWGESYFAEKLLDYDLASNNGGWQWAAGCGTDAQPYFRVFNPESQMKKFDKNKVYIRRWVPEFGTDAYPAPMVEHKMARERAISTYKRALTGSEPVKL